MRQFAAAAAAALLLTGCGYVGGPLPPLANIPASITDLAAIQRGARIYVHFTVPTLTTENVTMKSPPRLDLRIGPGPDPFNADQWATQAKPIPEGPVEKGIATYVIPSTEWTGKDAIVGVRVIGSNGKESSWSNFEVVSVVPPPEKPANLRAEPAAAGVRLSWDNPGRHTRIFRKTGAGPFAAVANIEGQHEWTDPDTEVGKPYQYLVQTIVPTANNREAESELSEPVSITPADRFPPVAPSGLTATAAPNSIELAWDQNTEPDLAGYRIYRAAPNGDFVKLADVSLVPSYSDKTAEHGKTFRYAVAAVDKSGNESLRSASVEAAIP